MTPKTFIFSFSFDVPKIHFAFVTHVDVRFAPVETELSMAMVAIGFTDTVNRFFIHLLPHPSPIFGFHFSLPTFTIKSISF